MEEMKWKDEYNVGCDYVDKAHQKLFSVLRKVEALLEQNDYNKNRFACVETIKFLYDYTKTHFAQEEAFMRETGYSGYEMHKKLHDNLRDVTVPALDTDLRQNDYSKESVAQFIGVFTGWLAGHILVEDKAITGRAVSKWKYSSSKECEDALDFEFKKVMKELSGADVTLINRHYEGVPIENAFFYEMNYPDTKIVFIAQNPIILKMVSDMLGVKQVTMNKTVLLTYTQLVQSLAKAVLRIVKPDEIPVLESHKSISADVLLEYFKVAFPAHSMEWKTALGYLAICVIDEIK